MASEKPSRSKTEASSTSTKTASKSKSDRDTEKENKKRKLEEAAARKKTPSKSKMTDLDKNISEQKTREEAKELAKKYVADSAEEDNQSAESAEQSEPKPTSQDAGSEEVYSTHGCHCFGCNTLRAFFEIPPNKA